MDLSYRTIRDAIIHAKLEFEETLSDVEELIKNFVSHCEKVQFEHPSMDLICQFKSGRNVNAKDIVALKGEVGMIYYIVSKYIAALI